MRKPKRKKNLKADGENLKTLANQRWALFFLKRNNTRQKKMHDTVEALRINSTYPSNYKTNIFLDKYIYCPITCPRRNDKEPF